MKKGYYIHFDARIVPGVDKKIEMQIKEFKKHFDIEQINIRPLERSLIKRVLGLFPTASIDRDYDTAIETMKDPDFLYVRRTTCDRKYLEFFKRVKERYPKCRILTEIFTYPYDRDDFAKWDAWPFYIKEKLYRNKLKRYIDRFVVYTDDEKIFGIKTLKTVNGIDLGEVHISTGEYEDNLIRMIGVAYMQRQHGFERVIQGLGEFYRKNPDPETEVKLLLVGDGPEKEKYIRLAAECKVSNHIEFRGSTVGRALDELYDQSDLTLGAFGMYKNNFHGCMSALKTRESLAKGLPIVSGCLVDVMKEDNEFVRYYPNDRSTIDIDEIASFMNGLKEKYHSRNEVAKKIRGFAEKTVGIDTALKPIIDYIDSEVVTQ